MNKINNILVVTGLLVSLFLSLYAAQPWDDNYAYQTTRDYIILALLNLWVLFPFILLYLINKAYQHSARHMRLMFGACFIGSIGAACIYIKSIMYSTSSTSSLIFLFLPAYQLGFIIMIWLVCLSTGQFRFK
jgi:hypothetical protein